MEPEAFARYATVRDILQGAYGNQRVRIIGKSAFSFW
jgi:hypothetical protein